MNAVFAISPSGLACLLTQIAGGGVGYAMPGDNVMRLCINAETATFAGCQASTPMERQSTSRADYDRGARMIIANLRAGGGKAVYSRVIVGHSHTALTEAMALYLGTSPDTFRFCFVTPEGDVWFGASPELLLDNRPAEGSLYTCALAGTRSAAESDSKPWDHKNLEEHRIVVDFINACLAEAGLSPETGHRGTLRHGVVTHLHTPITAHAAPDCRRLLAALSPTPALAGYPRRRALSLIADAETHCRSYYGGYVAVKLDGGRTVAYVILRSIRAMACDNGFDYNIFVGGGLTSESDVDAEWLETQLKAEVMLKAVEPK